MEMKKRRYQQNKKTRKEQGQKGGWQQRGMTRREKTIWMKKIDYKEGEKAGKQEEIHMYEKKEEKKSETF